jgi:hypothetical protein
LTIAFTAYAKEKSIEELKAKLQSATRPDDKASLSMQIAEREVDAAERLFKDDKSDAAQKAVADCVHYSEQARDNAGLTGHRLKKIEISVRKLAYRLTDLKRELTYEDQAPVQSAIDQLEKIRTDLLDRMFKLKK